MVDEDDPADFYKSGNLSDEESPRMGHNSGLDEEDALEGMNFEDMLKESRKALLKRLYGLMVSGMATPADLNNLRQLLKDNGMVMGDPTEGAGDGGQKKSQEPRPLPSFPKPEYDS